MKLKTKFQDEDFEFGEVVEANIFYSGGIHQGFKVVATARNGGQHTFYYDSIKDFTDHWEDAPEEPETFGWCIDEYNEPEEIGFGFSLEEIDHLKEIGLWFKTKEETELAVEKLKAWKRLKDKGFRFEGIKEDYTRILQSQKPFRTGKRYLQFNKSEDEEWMKENWEDLDLLFSVGDTNVTKIGGKE